MNLLVKSASLSLDIFRKISGVLDAVLSGFWLGILGEKGVEKFNDLHYAKTRIYMDDKYNLSGLQGWEYERMKKFFSHARTFMIIGAGGGRETATLRKWEREVDSYECSEKLVQYGNDFLRRNQIEAVISLLPKNTVPENNKKYQGIILGWGAYSHIQGSKNRISLLSSIRMFCNEDTRIMISFLARDGSGRKDRMTKNVSNFFRFFSGSPKTETGDRLISYYAHFFNREEVESELNQAGYQMIDYTDSEYGCAIGEPTLHFPLE